MSSSEILGLIAGFLSTFAILPQIMRVYKLKSAREISFIYNTMLLSGIVMWLVYGIMLDLVPLIVWNVIGGLLVLMLLLAKLRYGR